MKPSSGIVNTNGSDNHAPGERDSGWILRCPLVDGLVVTYLAFTGLIYLFDSLRGHVHLVGVLLHLLSISAILTVRRFLLKQPEHRWKSLRFLHAWYPPAALPFIYKELAVLNRIIWDRYFDPIVQVWERILFEQSPVMWLSEWMNSFWMSEYLHFSYTFYYLMIPILGFALYGRRRYRAFESYIWTLMMTFFFCYLWFIFFPVEGPRYSFPSLAEQLQHGPFYRLSHWILERGAARGAAFPSSHVAAAVVTLLCAWKWDRKVFIGLLPLGVGLVLGTVYGRFHYGVDALAGLIVAFIFYHVGPASYHRLSLRYCASTKMPPSP